jgi:hypothetical protein
VREFPDWLKQAMTMALALVAIGFPLAMANHRDQGPLFWSGMVLVATAMLSMLIALIAHARDQRIAARDKPEARVVVRVKPDQLMDFYNDRLTSEGDRLVAPYMGKWMSVTAPVHNVSGHFLTVKISDDRTTFCIFRPTWESRLSVLTRNEDVTVQGKIRRVTRLDLDLENCELI